MGKTGRSGGGTKSSSYSIYKFKNCFFLFIYEMIDVNWTYCGNRFTVYVNQAIILYALTLYSDSGYFSVKLAGKVLVFLESLYNVNVKLLYDFFLLKRLIFLGYLFYIFRQLLTSLTKFTLLKKWEATVWQLLKIFFLSGAILVRIQSREQNPLW